MRNFFALIIEDDVDLGDIYAGALQLAGFSTTIINDGAKASERLKYDKPDLVVLDMHLPYVAGTELLQQIRASRHIAKIPVIVATADHRLGILKDKEANIVLIKPISFSQLSRIAERLRQTIA